MIEDIKTEYIPSIYDEYNICENLEGKIGLGKVQYWGLDSFEVSDMLGGMFGFSGSKDCFLCDIDADGINDILTPLGFDFTGDGINDYAVVIDLNGNGIPDASPDSPFYPSDSPEYTRYLRSQAKTSDTIVTKPINDYTVTEGILLIFLIVGAFKLIGKVFRRKRVVK